jgi:hypothetical protein
VEVVDRGETNSSFAHNSRIIRSQRKRNMKIVATLSILFSAVPTMARPNMRSLYRVDMVEAAADEQIYTE